MSLLSGRGCGVAYRRGAAASVPVTASRLISTGQRFKPTFLGDLRLRRNTRYAPRVPAYRRLFASSSTQSLYIVFEPRKDRFSILEDPLETDTNITTPPVLACMKEEADKMQPKNTLRNEGQTIQIHDLENAQEFVDSLLSTATTDPSTLASITTLRIQTPPISEEVPPPDDAEGTDRIAHRAQQQRTTQAQWETLAAPLTQLLEALDAQNAHLTHFHWTSRYSSDQDAEEDWSVPGHRPASFWTTLYRHAPTLQSLRIGFFVHELHRVPVPAPPPGTTFPALRELKVDATTAHGDDGRAVDAVLKGAAGPASALESLTFHWPGCDLESCQIRGLAWGYAFPKLKLLDLNGNVLGGKAWGGVEAMLRACPEVEAFVDGVSMGAPAEDGVDTEKNEDDANRVYADTDDGTGAVILPRLATLVMAGWGASPQGLQDWFDIEDGRPLANLTITQWGGTLSSIPDSDDYTKSGLARLESLTLETCITDWRLREAESSSDSDSDPGPSQADDDDEDDVADVQGVPAITSTTKNDRPETGAEMGTGTGTEPSKLSPLADALKSALPHLPSLTHLTLVAESSQTFTKDEESGDFVNPPPAEEADLRTMLSLLPRASAPVLAGKKEEEEEEEDEAVVATVVRGIKELRIVDTRGVAWKDEWVRGVDADVMPESLEKIVWCGAEGESVYLCR